MVVKGGIDLGKIAYIHFAAELHANLIQPVQHILQSGVHAVEAIVDVYENRFHLVLRHGGFGQEEGAECFRFWGVLPVEGIVVGQKLLFVRHIVGFSLMAP